MAECGMCARAAEMRVLMSEVRQGEFLKSGILILTRDRITADDLLRMTVSRESVSRDRETRGLIFFTYLYK